MPRNQYMPDYTFNIYLRFKTEKLSLILKLQVVVVLVFTSASV